MRALGNGMHCRCSDKALAWASWHLWFSLQKNWSSAANGQSYDTFSCRICQTDTVLHVAVFVKVMMDKNGEVKSMMGQTRLYNFHSKNHMHEIRRKEASKYKPPEVKLKAFTLVLAFQTGSSGSNLMAQGYLPKQHKDTKRDQHVSNTSVGQTIWIQHLHLWYFN